MENLKKHVTKINVEMSGDTKRYLVSAKQGDKSTRHVIATLLNDGALYEIPEEARVIANIEKPDGKHVYNDCDFSGAVVTLVLTNQILAVAGTAFCDIEVRSPDNEQVITSASFTIEIEKTQRNADAIESCNEITGLEKWINEHIAKIESTNETVTEAENARTVAEEKRISSENSRIKAEETRQENENNRNRQERQRQQDTSQAVKNTNEATDASKKATTACKEVTERAEDALQNQEQLEATLNTATKIRQEVSQMQTAVAEAKKQVEQDKKDIDDTIQNSLLASAEKILESVQGYFKRAEALYSSMYLDCDGETPYMRTVTPIFIDGATPQVRNANEGVDFDGGTPTSRQLAV